LPKAQYTRIKSQQLSLLVCRPGQIPFPKQQGRRITAQAKKSILKKSIFFARMFELQSLLTHI